MSTLPFRLHGHTSSAAAAGRLLRASGYDLDGIRRLLQLPGPFVFAPRELPVFARRLEGDETPLATLVRLFLIDQPNDPDATARALGEPLSELRELGLVAEEAGALYGTVRIVPHESLLIASDTLRVESGAEHVSGVFGPSEVLSLLTIRRPVSRAVDVGTGNGIQALRMAPHAGHVVATDISERALGFAELNAALNDVRNVEFRAGSFLEPVAGERFGLVAANPPYVISPEKQFVFRDSGLGRDRVSEQLVRTVPELLEDGAFATVMISWIVDGDDIVAAPRTWTEQIGCDAWLFRTGLEDPLRAAITWNAPAEDERELGGRIDSWLDYFRTEGISAIGYGGLVLRRRATGDNWFRTIQLPDRRGPACSAHLLQLFEAYDGRAGVDDAELLERFAAIAPYTSFESRSRVLDSGWTTTDAALSADAGLGFRTPLDPAASAVLARLGAPQPVRDAVAAAAAAGGVALDAFTPPALALLRRLIELGFVELRPSNALTVRRRRA